MNGGRGRRAAAASVIVATVAVMVIALVVAAQRAGRDNDEGPLVVGYSARSGMSVPTGRNVGYGLVVLKAPDERTWTVLAARPITDEPDDALAPTYAFVGERGIGGVQFLPWPPSDPELTVPAVRLPAPIEGGDWGTEIVVGLRVDEDGVAMRGVQVVYTDGERVFSTLVPQSAILCIRDQAGCRKDGSVDPLTAFAP